MQIPADFQEEVELATRARRVGDLQLFAEELQGFEWAVEGLRIIGRALVRITAFKSAAEIWAAVRRLDPLDPEANANASHPQVPAPASEPAPGSIPGRMLLFTGHMIDAPDRKEPRFPPGKEAVARQAIQRAVQTELSESGGVAYGIAGGASGGDILFQEVCAELQVPTGLFLALSRDEYVRHSVQSAGPQWVERFLQLCDSHPPRVLSESRDESEYLPPWLRDKADYGIWQRNALWMLHNALVAGDGGTTLIALWDGKGGDGPGGTADVVKKASARGAKAVIINTTALFGPLSR